MSLCQSDYLSIHHVLHQHLYQIVPLIISPTCCSSNLPFCLSLTIPLNTSSSSRLSPILCNSSSLTHLSFPLCVWAELLIPLLPPTWIQTSLSSPVLPLLLTHWLFTLSFSLHLSSPFSSIESQISKVYFWSDFLIAKRWHSDDGFEGKLSFLSTS